MTSEDFPTMAARMNAQTVIELQAENHRLRRVLAEIGFARPVGTYAEALAKITLTARKAVQAEEVEPTQFDHETREIFERLQSAHVCAAARKVERS